jgi:hypothetical protein
VEPTWNNKLIHIVHLVGYFHSCITMHGFMNVNFVNNQLDAQFFFMYVYFYSLHVSGSHVPIIRRINCINTTSGICHSVYRVAEKSPYTDQLAIKKTQINSVAAANHVCTILHTVANLPFYTVLRAALCSVNIFESEVRIVWVYGDFSATL